MLCCGIENHAAINRKDFNLQLSMGQQCIDSHDYAGAFNIYHKLASQYKSNLSAADKLLALEAIYGCIESSIYKVSYADAINYLMLAEDIRESENVNDGRLHLFYCDLYIVYGSQTGKESVFNYAFAHARKALDYFITHSDWSRAEKAFGNMVNLWYVLDKTPEREKAMKTAMESFQKKVPNRWQKLNKLFFFKARREEDCHNERKATEYYDSILSVIPDVPENSNLRAHMLIYAAWPRHKSGETVKAIAGLDSAMKATIRTRMSNLQDIALSNYNMIYTDLGYNDKASEYAHRSLELRDSMRSFAMVDDLFNLENMHRQKELRKEVSEARYRHKVTMWISLFLTLVVITVVVFLIILRKKNHALRERAGLLRKLLRERNEEVQTREDAKKNQRYDGSNLTKDDKEQIAADIRKVLDSPAVFSCDFSLSTLAQSVGRTQKAVSQVVNEVFDTNFPTMVNKIRIYEACRRIDSPEYNNWSVEGIAESVGYNQRNTFSCNFKKFTGMGIREYRKLSEEEKKNK